MNASIATLAGVLPDGFQDGFTMHDHAPDDGPDGLADELRPFDQILRQASQGPLPEPPDGLCHRTLERCLAHAVRPAGNDGLNAQDGL
jgi:hypothetical protein